jgi:calcineurin-like phosphoesterase family protein
MTHNIFYIADTHFGHNNILKYTRGRFGSIEEHDEHIVERWNDTVRASDKIYLLGDVVINRRCIPILSRLNGRKVLVRGNHDLFHLKDWLPYFEDIKGCSVSPHGFIATHIPVHPDTLTRWSANVHGHLHDEKIADTRYICVSCEQVDYTPVPVETILKRIAL